MNTDNTLSRALHDLSEVPGPESMADNALRRARARRLKGYAASTVGAFVAVAVIAAPFLLTGGGKAEQSGGQFAAAAPSGPPPSAAAVNPNGGLCEPAPSEPGVKKVLPQNWPAYVRAAVDRLPTRADYVMQSGTLRLCNGEAYSVVNLGEHREAGHITVRLSTQPDAGSPTDCDLVKAAWTNPDAPPPPYRFKVLFCEQGGGFKMMYGIDDGYHSYRVYAIYPDGRTVSMESLSAGGGAAPVITAEQLRTVVTDPAMLAFFN